MKAFFKIFVIIFYLILTWNRVFAQVRVDDRIDPISAVNRLVGQGVKVSNIEVDCPSERKRPWGYFTDNTGTLGIKEGLIMTSGAATNAVGPNNSGAISQKNRSREFNDTDLEQLVTGNDKIYDRCAISFTVQVFADTLVFEYVFGSDEYLEFVESYHDVFGFFISGPGLPGKVNLALIPGANVPTSVANVNNKVNSRYYVDNGSGATPYKNLFVQYDGFTRRLTSKIKVIPCAEYQLKMAICDVRDNSLDAGIFIEGKSLRTKSPQLSIKYDFEQFKYGIEGCNNANLIITREALLSESQVLYLRKDGTAKEGVDYGTLPDSVVFLPGEKEKTIKIQLFKDTLKEGEETGNIMLINPCPGLPEIANTSFKIRESFEYDAPDEKICFGDSIKLNEEAPGELRFEWKSDLSLSCLACRSPFAKPFADRKYFLTAIDTASGCKAFDSLEVKVFPVPVANFSFANSPEYTKFDFFFTNMSTLAESYAWNFGDGKTSEEENPFHAFELGGEKEKTFKIILTAKRNDPACEDTASANITIRDEDKIFIPNLITVDKNGENDFFVIKGVAPGIWKVQIFNRFGKLVYDDKAYKMDWNAKDMPAGTYFYTLKNPKENRVFKGWLEVTKEQ